MVVVLMMDALAHPKDRYERCRSAWHSDFQSKSVTWTSCPSKAAARQTWCRARKPTRQRSIPSVTHMAAIAGSSSPWPNKITVTTNEKSRLVSVGFVLKTNVISSFCRAYRWWFAPFASATLCPALPQLYHKYCAPHTNGHCRFDLFRLFQPQCPLDVADSLLLVVILCTQSTGKPLSESVLHDPRNFEETSARCFASQKMLYPYPRGFGNCR